MVELKLDIKKIKIKLPKFKSGSRFGLLKNRDRDWQIIIRGALIVTVIVALFSFYIFFRINEGKFFRSIDVEDMPIRTINKEVLEKTVNSIKNDRIRFNNALQIVPSTSNPAL